MRQGFIILLFLTCLLSGVSFGMDQGTILKTEPTYPHTRALINAGFNIDFSWLFMPAAMIADVFSSIKDVAQDKIIAGKQALHNISEVLDTMMYEYSSIEIHDMAWEGYRKRLEQIKPHIKDLNLGQKDMNIFVFACTAWDSKDKAPEGLVLAGGKTLKRKILINHNADIGDCFLSLYDRIAEASSFIAKTPALNSQSFDQFMASLSSQTSPESQILKSYLEKAALELQDILKGLFSR